VPDYATPRQWLVDEGYYRKDVATAEDMRKVAAEIRAEGLRMVELADGALEAMAQAEAVADWAKANPEKVA